MEPAVETPLAELLPDGASVEDGALVLGGVSAAELAREYGTPLVVYDELTLRAQASAYRTAGGDYTYLTRAYGSKVGFMFAWAEPLRCRAAILPWL